MCNMLPYHNDSPCSQIIHHFLQTFFFSFSPADFSGNNLAETVHEAAAELLKEMTSGFSDVNGYKTIINLPLVNRFQLVEMLWIILC